MYSFVKNKKSIREVQFSSLLSFVPIFSLLFSLSFFSIWHILASLLMFVVVGVMASPTVVWNATLMWMSNVVWSQTSLLMKVTSINLFYRGHPSMRSAVVVIIMQKEEYLGVLIVNSLWMSYVLHCCTSWSTDSLNSPSNYVIKLKMVQMVNITVIFVKKNEIQSIGSTTVKS